MVSKALAGVFHSLRLYQGGDAPRAAMDALYSRFVTSGDLVFDVGAHVGDRVSSFRRLGATVVALEPQPLLFRTLRLIHGRDSGVSLLSVAAGPSSGEAKLAINSANPTVSTLSRDFVAHASGQSGWEGQVWDSTLAVPVYSLDGIIAKYGAPAFIKIDVEGYEHDVLLGLSSPVAALSFEFTTIARDVARQAMERIGAIGDYVFDVALGESQALVFDRWLTADAMSEFLSNLPHEANSGDVYARRRDLT